MFVRRKRLFDAALGHDDEREAIGQAPFLVPALGEQRERSIKKGAINADDVNGRIGA